MRAHKWWTGLAISISVVALAACGSQDDSADSAAEQSPSAGAGQDAGAQGTEQGGGPDVSGIPDVVAEVNGEKILKEDFVPLFETQYQQMAMQSQSTGQQVDEGQLKKQTAENMVSTELLSQEADKRGISVSDEDVKKGLKETAESSQMSEEDFLKAMKDQGLDEAGVHEQLGQQLAIEGLIKDEHGEFKVTDEEIGAAYEQAKTQQEQMGAQSGQQAPMPPLEEVRPQLEEQVKSQKENEATQKYAGELRKDAKVTINL